MHFCVVYPVCDLHADSSTDEQYGSGDVVPGQCLSEVDVRHDDTADAHERKSDGNGVCLKSLHCLVKAEDGEKAGEESVRHDNAEECVRNGGEFLDKRMIEEWRAHEEEGESDDSAEEE